MQENQNQARQIIDSLLHDSELYKQMSEKESYVWGTIFSNEKRNDLIKEDQEAAKELRLNRIMSIVRNFIP